MILFPTSCICCHLLRILLIPCSGFKALVEAFTEVAGDCKPYSITGSLPCIRDLQEAGFDVQTMGFGKLAAYHANNEYGFLSDFKKGFRVLVVLMQKYEEAMRE
jgi:acetylornithine deacetylase